MPSFMVALRDKYRHSRSRKDDSDLRDDLAGKRCCREAAPGNDQQGQRLGLLESLPEEIRRMVWQFALGYHLLHLRVRKSLPNAQVDTSATGSDLRLRRFPCYCKNDANTWDHPCTYPHKFNRDSTSRDTILALLLVCKQTYHECVDLLYSHNTFHLHSIVDFRLLGSVFPSNRVADIRSLRIGVLLRQSGSNWTIWVPSEVETAYPYMPPCAYKDLFDLIRSMPSLRQLRLLINLHCVDQETWDLYGDLVLQPIRGLTHLWVQCYLVMTAGWVRGWNYGLEPIDAFPLGQIDPDNSITLTDTVFRHGAERPLLPYMYARYTHHGNGRPA